MLLGCVCGCMQISLSRCADLYAHTPLSPFSRSFLCMQTCISLSLLARLLLLSFSRSLTQFLSLPSHLLSPSSPPLPLPLLSPSLSLPLPLLPLLSLSSLPLPLPLDGIRGSSARGACQGHARSLRE
jgi:hypothetical protein